MSDFKRKPTVAGGRLAIRIVLLQIGLSLIAMSSAIFSKAALGYDPFMIFDSGISKASGISLGMTHVLINGTLLLIFLLLRKIRYINIGTVLAMATTGPLIDLFTKLIQAVLPGEPALLIRLPIALAACVMEGVGVYLYTGVRMGAGPNDLVAVILSDTLQKPLGIVRISVDGVWTAAGLLLGGRIGVGTLLALILVGGTVQVCGKVFSNRRALFRFTI